MIGIRIVATLVAALAVFGAAAPPLAAAQTLQQVQSVGEWTAEFNRVLTTFITPLQAIPAAPEPRMTRRERQDWAAAAREWGTNAQGAFASARMDLQRMPPSPPAHDAMSEQLRTAVEQALPRLREAFDAGDRVAAAYLAMADAVERNQMDRIASVRGAAIEASMITMRLFQDINATQAAAMQQGNPQRPLIQSYAISYEAVWAFLNFKREILNSGAGDRQDAAAAMSAAARRMRAVIAGGRADLASMQAELNNPIIAASIDPVLLPRLRELAATFPASFDREDELAGDIEAMAALLLDPRDLIAVEPEIDQRMDVFAAREMRRLEDVQRRNAIMIAP